VTRHLGLALLIAVGTATALPGQARCQPTERAVVVTEKDADRSVELRLGEELVVKLEVVRGSGFSWQIQKIDTKRLRPLDPVPDEPLDPPKPGAAALQVLRFRAVGEGSQDLELAGTRASSTSRTRAS